jgi:hypothetical protein
VFRYLDRESVYLRSRILTPLLASPANLIFNVIIFRAYLNSGTAMDLMGLQDIDTFTEAGFLEGLARIQAKTGKISNAAYNVGAFQYFASDEEQGTGSKPARAGRMFDTIRQKVRPLLAELLKATNSDTTYKLVTELPGVGSFIGYQICVDLGYWNKAVYDDDEHVILGPGAKKGLLWLFDPSSTLTKIQQIHHLRDIHAHYVQGTDLFEHVTAPMKTLGLMELENGLCEGHKYFRCKSKSGRFKQYYTGSGSSENYRSMLASTGLMSPAALTLAHNCTVEVPGKGGGSVQSSSNGRGNVSSSSSSSSSYEDGVSNGMDSDTSDIDSDIGDSESTNTITTTDSSSKSSSSSSSSSNNSSSPKSSRSRSSRSSSSSSSSTSSSSSSSSSSGSSSSTFGALSRDGSGNGTRSIPNATLPGGVPWPHHPMAVVTVGTKAGAGVGVMGATHGTGPGGTAAPFLPIPGAPPPPVGSFPPPPLMVAPTSPTIKSAAAAAVAKAVAAARADGHNMLRTAADKHQEQMFKLE